MPQLADKRKYLQPETVAMLNSMALRARDTSIGNYTAKQIDSM